MMRLIMFTNLLYLVLLGVSSLSASVIQNAGDSCSDNQWKCDDGSCISIDGKWNGDVKCNDSSVPSRTLRRKTRQAQNSVCVMPEYPANGTYTTHIPNAKPGQAYDLVTITVTCDQGFALVGSASAYCDKGWWSETMPKCVSQCYLPPHPSVEYRCLITGVEGSRVCAGYETNGTVVRPQCRSPNFYSATVLTYMRCIDGSWDHIAKCSPECGTFSSSGTDLITGGQTAKRAEVPWHAAIYTKTTNPYRQICGGSLISNNIILSAAHCFWNNLESKQLPAAVFAVAVGKLYRPWNDDKEDAQRSDVKALHLPPLFQGSAANNQEDIAVVVVTTPFVYTTYIRPVCVDFDNFFQNRQLKVGNMGKVAGWGLTAENGMPSQVLKVINLPYVSIETCINNSPPGFRGYITGDKICAGFKNEHKAVCKGDSGGGLAFPESERGTPRYYLRGIVSAAPITNHLCNANAYTTFTGILRHEHFIKQFWEDGARYYSDMDEAMRAPQDEQPVQSSTSSPNTILNVRAHNNSDFKDTMRVPQDEQPTHPSTTPPNTTLKVRELMCKELLLKRHSWSPAYSIDNATLKQVTVHRSSAGNLTYLAMHIAVQAYKVRIRLTDKRTESYADVRFDIEVGFNENKKTQLDLYSHGSWRYTVQNINTPNILSPTEFRDFYVKIDDGKLQFGKEGDSSPIISHDDARLSEVNYFQFYFEGSNQAKIRYDCPAPVQGHTFSPLKNPMRAPQDEQPAQPSTSSPNNILNVRELMCKELLVNRHSWSPAYSMDNATLKQVTVHRSSAGNLTYLAMHIAVQADKVRIRLTDKRTESYADVRFDIEVGFNENKKTQLDTYSHGSWRYAVQNINTPNILSPTEFRGFYVRIDDGKLQFGKEGDSSPIISHDNDRLSEVNYFQFYFEGSNEAKIRYDCPASVEGSS